MNKGLCRPLCVCTNRYYYFFNIKVDQDASDGRAPEKETKTLPKFCIRPSCVQSKKQFKILDVVTNLLKCIHLWPPTASRRCKTFFRFTKIATFIGHLATNNRSEESSSGCWNAKKLINRGRNVMNFYSLLGRRDTQHIIISKIANREKQDTKYTSQFIIVTS